MDCISDESPWPPVELAFWARLDALPENVRPSVEDMLALDSICQSMPYKTAAAMKITQAHVDERAAGETMQMCLRAARYLMGAARDRGLRSLPIEQAVQICGKHLLELLLETRSRHEKYHVSLVAADKTEKKQDGKLAAHSAEFDIRSGIRCLDSFLEMADHAGVTLSAKEREQFETGIGELRELRMKLEDESARGGAGKQPPAAPDDVKAGKPKAVRVWGL